MYKAIGIFCLLCKAVLRHGFKIHPCGKRKWENCFEFNKCRKKVYFILWYNSKDDSSHIVRVRVNKKYASEAE